MSERVKIAPPEEVRMTATYGHAKQGGVYPVVQSGLLLGTPVYLVVTEGTYKTVVPQHATEEN